MHKLPNFETVIKQSSAFWSVGEQLERLWHNLHYSPRKSGVPVLVQTLEIRTEISDCFIMLGNENVREGSTSVLLMLKETGLFLLQ